MAKRQAVGGRSGPAAGRRAPAFRAPDESGNPVSLKAFAGRPLVLYFYPKDFTPGCTLEAAGFRDRWAPVVKTGAAVVGVSRDSSAMHRRFKERLKLPFILLADERAVVCRAYGVWRTKSLYGRTYKGIVRTTFVIDGKGVVRKRFDNVSVKGHVDEVLAALREL